VAITPGITDLSGKNSPLPLTVAFPAGPADRLGYRRADPTEIPTSSAANLYGFHGHEVDPATGLVYMRNRWYDPAMGRFVTADPLGYVDGPGTYAFAGGDPANSSDPLGLYAEAGHYYTVLWVALQVGYGFDEAQSIAFFAQFPDEASLLDAKELWWDSKEEASANKFRRGARTVSRDRMVRHHTAIHALTGGDAARETQLAVEGAKAAPDNVALGLQLHRLGDSFAHRELNNESKLYDTGFGHAAELNAGTSPDTIQRRPDLYLDYISELAAVLAARRGTSVSEELKASMHSSASRFAARPSTDDRWYRWRNSDNGPLELEAVASLRALIFQFGKAAGRTSEAAQVLAYRPESWESGGRSVDTVLKQFRGSKGRLVPLESGIESAIEAAIKYSVGIYEASH
jgi:RHS repeat-associated protein